MFRGFAWMFHLHAGKFERPAGTVGDGGKTWLRIREYRGRLDRRRRQTVAAAPRVPSFRRHRPHLAPAQAVTGLVHQNYADRQRHALDEPE
jgi:hypothetical protein